jgi:hypothetical protein
VGNHITQLLWHSESAMKLLLAILALLLAVGSIYADYKWRRWMARRAAEKDASATPDHR